MLIIESLREQFFEICVNEIKREGIDKVIEWLDRSDFFKAPASTKYHGNYAGGLAKHSINVYNCLKEIIKKYPELQISGESIAICALLHDVCKVNFYKLGYRNVKNEETGVWEKKEQYEIDDKTPLGHGEKSCIILQWFMRLTLPELLAIRWHMGGFDNAVKGGDFSSSKAYETSPLAVMLHLADMEATYLKEDINV
jgi:hypothetical protein